ncbi:MAG: YkgJ family cysteine cluster protein [Bacteroidota bacterium]|nr:YkgJ family cysteine cluster protein [bacterium]NBP63507.1 YkgJ family cysteine cluster protein [Bacteroidota bacterium]
MEYECRVGCGACCIVISINSPIPGMPLGKPAGMRCIHLTHDNLCSIFDSPERPTVCTSLKPMKDMCGESNEEAFQLLSVMEVLTDPHRIS